MNRKISDTVLKRINEGVNTSKWGTVFRLHGITIYCEDILRFKNIGNIKIGEIISGDEILCILQDLSGQVQGIVTSIKELLSFDCVEIIRGAAYKYIMEV